MGQESGKDGAEIAARAMREALAAIGPPKDRGDRLAHFVGEQIIDMHAIVSALSRRQDLLQAQVALLLRQLRRRRIDARDDDDETLQ